MYSIHTRIDTDRSFTESNFDFEYGGYKFKRAFIYGYFYAFEKIDGEYKHIKHDIYNDFILYITPQNIELTVTTRAGEQHHYKAKLIPNNNYCFKINKKSISSCYLPYSANRLNELFIDDTLDCYRDGWIENIIKNEYFKID